jgi:hypothetical protein
MILKTSTTEREHMERSLRRRRLRVRTRTLGGLVGKEKRSRRVVDSFN